VKLFYGVVFGGVMILMMNLAWGSDTGVFYDSRTVLISVIASMYSVYSTIIMIVIGSAYRIYIGGIGMVAGVVTIVATGILGILYKKFILNKLKKNIFLYNLMFGLVIHIGMLSYHFLLPADMDFIIGRIKSIAPVVLLLYPIFVAVFADIIRYNDKKIESEEDLRESEEKYRLLYNSMNTGILHFDENGIITDCNERFLEIMNASNEEMIGLDMNTLPNKQMQRALLDVLTGACANFHGPYESFLSGKEMHLDVMFNPLFKDSKFIGGVGIALDITEGETMRLDMEKMTNTDPQTNLNNRKKLEEDLELKKYHHQHPLEYTMISLDNLQFYIDTLGYNESDKLVRDFVECLLNLYPNKEYIYRTSLNDFAIIHPLSDGYKIDDIIYPLRKDIKKIDYLPTPLFISHSTVVKETNEENDWLDISNTNRNRIRLIRTYSKSRITKNSIDILLATLFEKSSRERQHSERVSSLAYLLGKEIKMEDESLMRLRSAAVLHDIGKINIDLSILDKPGKLSKAEYSMIQSHTESGSRILATVPEYKELSKIVVSHHENYDGTGYPFGTKAELIPIESRIISIVDAYDAMTNDRPYRSALTKDEAIKELLANSGTQFDPQLVDAFVTIIKTNIAKNHWKI